MIIDAVDTFIEIQKAVMFDRKLAQEYGIVELLLPEDGGHIIIDGRMIAFIPED